MCCEYALSADVIVRQLVLLRATQQFVAVGDAADGQLQPRLVVSHIFDILGTYYRAGIAGNDMDSAYLPIQKR